MEKIKLRKEFRFPDGTYHCLVDPPESGDVIIDGRDFDFVRIALQKNALQNLGFTGKILLNLPYIPGSRQDRICNEGEPFTLKVIASLINSLKFDAVLVFEPHSDVAGALIENCVILGVDDLPWLQNPFNNYDVFVAPDAGASKRVLKICQSYKKGFVQANKVRDVSTGSITKIEVSEKLDPNTKYLIIDDICSMGGTFIGLQKSMVESGASPENIALLVAHVDKKNGLEALANIFPVIYTTNSQGDFLVPKNVIVEKYF